MNTSTFRFHPRYEAFQGAVEQLRGQYQALKVFPIGTSVLGREIPALSIGNPMGATVFVGATHGLEWLTTLLLLQFLQELLEGLETGGSVSDIDIRVALQSRSLVVIPLLNPDGVEIALGGPDTAGENAELVRSLCPAGDHSTRWQANANGVDLNHNFDAGWTTLKELELSEGIDRPAPTRYGGPHPHSEPETMAMARFCNTWQPRTLYALHSQGEEIYYRYGARTPQRSRLMAQILASSSGYRLAAPTGLASHGGLKDWFVDKLCRPGFTIEVGKGKNPLQLDQLQPVYARIQEMLVLATLL